MIGAVLLSLTALSLWVCVGIWAWKIVGDDKARLAQASATVDSSGQYLTAVRKHALALEAASSSAALMDELNIDIVTLAQGVSGAGADTHVALAVSGVVPVSVAEPSAGPVALYEYDINVLGTGSFAAIMQTEQSLEHLPFPSRVEAFDIETSPGNSTLNILPQWTFTARIRVITSAHPTS